MKYLLTLSSLILLLLGITLGSLGHDAILWVCFLSFALLLCSANLDRISEFKASSSGIEAKTREVIGRAESTLKELHVLALQVAELSLSLAMRQGRYGGYSDEELTYIRQSVQEVLNKLGVSEAEYGSIFSDWHKVIEHDYATHILGHSRIPEVSSQEIISDLRIAI